MAYYKVKLDSFSGISTCIPARTSLSRFRRRRRRRRRRFRCI